MKDQGREWRWLERGGLSRFVVSDPGRQPRPLRTEEKNRTEYCMDRNEEIDPIPVHFMLHDHSAMPANSHMSRRLFDHREYTLRARNSSGSPWNSDGHHFLFVIASRKLYVPFCMEERLNKVASLAFWSFKTTVLLSALICTRLNQNEHRCTHWLSSLMKIGCRNLFVAFPRLSHHIWVLRSMEPRAREKELANF